LSQDRLSTSANETNSVRAHPRDRLRARLETPSLSRGVKSPCVCRSRTPARFPVRARRGQRAVRARSERVCSGRPTRLSTTRAEVQTRTDCHGAKDSQPFGLFAGSPPPMAAEHPSVTNLLPRTPGVRPPRLAWSIAPSFPGGEGPRLASQIGLGLHSTALPRRRTVCAKIRVLSTDRPERVRGSPPLRARSVYPSRRP